MDSTTHKNYQNYIKELHGDWKKPESPYTLNQKLLSMITELDKNFTPAKEREVLFLLNQIDEYPNMSKYQLSLTKKELADCYDRHGITGNALQLYLLALDYNNKLPIKRTIARLKQLDKSNLVYSLDINTIFDTTISSNTHSLKNHIIPEEYDAEFENYIHEELMQLGPDYMESFYKFLQIRDFEKDYFWSYKEWAERTLESFRNSKKAEDYHIECTSHVDKQILKKIAYDKQIILKPEEIRLLSKINNKQNLRDIPHYFSTEYNMDYQNVLNRLFASGYLTFSTLEYNVNKLTLPQLKEFLRQQKISTKGKKSDLVARVLGNFTSDELKTIPEYFVTTEMGATFLRNNDALLSFYNRFQGKRSWATPEQIIAEQALYPQKNGTDILIQILARVIENCSSSSLCKDFISDMNILYMWKKKSKYNT